jgi:dTMP kinase
MNERRGEYIVIEGIDGAGKSRQSELLVGAYPSHSVNTLNEPGGTKFGDHVRDILKDKSVTMSPETILSLFMLSRKEFVEQKMGEILLKQRVTLISDRNWWSSVAYQGFGDEIIHHSEIVELSKQAMGEYFLPDKSIILEVPIDVARERIDKRDSVLVNKKEDRFESKGIDYFQRVAEGYYWIADEFDIPIVNGNQTPEAVHEDIRKVLSI